MMTKGLKERIYSLFFVTYMQTIAHMMNELVILLLNDCTTFTVMSIHFNHLPTKRIYISTPCQDDARKKYYCFFSSFCFFYVVYFKGLFQWFTVTVSCLPRHALFYLELLL